MHSWASLFQIYLWVSAHFLPASQNISSPLHTTSFPAATHPEIITMEIFHNCCSSLHPPPMGWRWFAASLLSSLPAAPPSIKTDGPFLCWSIQIWDPAKSSWPGSLWFGGELSSQAWHQGAWHQDSPLHLSKVAWHSLGAEKPAGDVSTHAIVHVLGVRHVLSLASHHKTRWQKRLSQCVRWGKESSDPRTAEGPPPTTSLSIAHLTPALSNVLCRSLP